MLLFFAFNIDASKGFAHVKTFLYSFCFLCTGLFFVASGIQHFLFVDFVKSLVPSWIPWSVFWTYFSGVALFTIGVCFICHLNVTAMALVAGTMVLVWTIIIHIPRAFETMDNHNEWTALFEAVSFTSIFFLLSRVPNPALKHRCQDPLPDQ
jgi:uncharacterized membrane protein YphA (DoxX/SURF4 family)